MQKQYVRKVQQIGNGLGVRIAPELLQEVEVGKGDNVSLEFNPDSGGLKLSRVAPANPGLDDVQQQDETHESSENKSSENESIIDLADEKEKGQPDGVSKFAHCTSCGSDDIRVSGNQFHCFDCDVVYEVTPKGTKVVEANPVQIVDALEERVEHLEEAVDGLNNNSDKDKNPGGLLSRLGIEIGWTDGTEDDEDEDLMPVGAGENPGSDDDDDDDENGDPKGFITW